MGKNNNKTPGPQVGLITQDLSRKWLNRKVPEVFRHPADTKRSQTKQTLPNPPQEHPNSWGRLKPQRNPLGKIHEVFPHNSITLGVNAAKAGSYLGSRYETDVSSQRPTPAWGKISSNHSSSKKGERTLTLPETPRLQLWYLSLTNAITQGNSHCQLKSPVFPQEKDVQGWIRARREQPIY